MEKGRKKERSEGLRLGKIQPEDLKVDMGLALL